jgi:hypothetical protein
MIEGINPLTISSIYTKPFKRFGNHPYRNRLARRKNPILWWLFNAGDFQINDFIPPSVVILGANGNIVKQIMCKSNDRADKLAEELNVQLESFVNSLREQ